MGMEKAHRDVLQVLAEMPRTADQVAETMGKNPHHVAKILGHLLVRQFAAFDTDVEGVDGSAVWGITAEGVDELEAHTEAHTEAP